MVTNHSSAKRLAISIALTAAACTGAQQLPNPAAPTVANSPRLPADAPVTPPKVVCNGDKISIVANNSTLSSVLAEIHRCMGAKIDAPDSAGSTRIFDQLALGPATQVLSSLLSNTGYDYVIGASPADPDKVDTVMLLARASTDASSTSSAASDRGLSPNRRIWEQLKENARPHPANLDEVAAPAPTPEQPEPSAAADSTPASNTDQKPADAAAAPDNTPKAADSDSAPASAPATAAPVAPATPATDSNSNSAQPKSPTESQITSMEQLFEQRRQMMQQQRQQQSAPQR